MGSNKNLDYGGYKIKVSIQLVSPASGETFSHRLSVEVSFFGVSIQLVSPASGENRKNAATVGKGVIQFPFN